MIFIDWLAANPAVWLPLVGALYTLITKVRSEEEYAAIAAVSPRLAAFLKLGPALFPDLIKILRVLKDIWLGNGARK